MYLTKCLIKKKPSLNIYHYHKLLWELFPNRKDGIRDFLFWVQTQNNNYLEILLQSMQIPANTCDSIIIHETKSYNPQLPKDAAYQFVVRINPIYNHYNYSSDQGDNKKIGIRTAYKKVTDVEKWVQRIFKHHAKILDTEIYKEDPTIFVKGPDKVTFQTYLVHGNLQVENPDLLSKLLQKGIGRSKAFGCGLMLLRPLH